MDSLAGLKADLQVGLSQAGLKGDSLVGLSQAGLRGDSLAGLSQVGLKVGLMVTQAVMMEELQMVVVVG